jgi:hypothetical protein
MSNEDVNPQKLEKSTFEESVMQRFLEQFPEVQQQHIASIGNMEVIGCNTEISEEEITPLRDGFERIEQKLGKRAEMLFSGIKIYIASSITSRNQALPRQNAMLLDLEKIYLTVGEMEDLLAPKGEYRRGDQSSTVGRETNATEIGFIHELGHILEFKAHDDMDVAFAELDQAESPTEYGQKSAREDYAESWMYYICDGPLDERRRKIIEADIEVLLNES